MSIASRLAEALGRFEPRIESEASDPMRDVKDAIALDPKIGYYLRRLSVSTSYSFGRRRALYQVDYRNCEVSPSDIYVVSSREEVHGILCQTVGNYKKRLVVMAPPSVDVQGEYKRFSVANAAFYSNFTGAEYTMSQPALGSLRVCDFRFRYRIGNVKLEMMRLETDAEIKRIARLLFFPDMKDETKIFLAHNYLAVTIHYTLVPDANDLERSYMQSAYGALIKKKCVCQGYAEAFKLLMDLARIPCDIICGQTKGASTYHAWNLVRLNGGCDNYHLDVTWDSTGGPVSYRYFGLRDADFEGERTWNREYSAKCIGTRSLLAEARRGLLPFKDRLLRRGLDPHVFG